MVHPPHVDEVFKQTHVQKGTLDFVDKDTCKYSIVLLFILL